MLYIFNVKQAIHHLLSCLISIINLRLQKVSELLWQKESILEGMDSVHTSVCLHNFSQQISTNSTTLWGQGQHGKVRCRKTSNTFNKPLHQLRWKPDKGISWCNSKCFRCQAWKNGFKSENNHLAIIIQNINCEVGFHAKVNFISSLNLSGDLLGTWAVFGSQTIFISFFLTKYLIQIHP